MARKKIAAPLPLFEAAAPKLRRFGFLYYTENENDDGYRVIEAPDMQAAKDINKAQIIAEGTHGAYRLEAIKEVV